ncbi:MULTISPECIES: hypothetical protein [unclassified Rhodanobacter]|uniref:hypothetical protein n=1 Tax=unclassified Rhodanobacter TaxID=2621553 RepID=UPI0034E61149
MAEKMTLEDVLEQSGVMLGDGKLPTADQLVAWREAMALQLAQPSQAVAWMLESDGYVTYWPSAEIAEREQENLRMLGYRSTVTPLTRAIGNAQAEGVDSRWHAHAAAVEGH